MRRRIFFHMFSVMFLTTALFSPTGCLAGSGVSAPVSVSAPAAENSGETRGTWLWAKSIDTPAKRLHALGIIKRAHLNTVYLAVPPIGGNYGHGTPANFLHFLRAAKKQGLSVHAWFSNGRRPGKGRYADFREPNEQQAQTGWVLAVTKRFGHLLEGIHLDYIRYKKGEDVNFQGKMDGVTATIRSIRRALDSRYPGKKLTATCFRLVPSRVQRYHKNFTWQEDVPLWFRQWFNHNPGSIYHGKHVQVPMHMKYQQDPVGWLKASLVDAVIPMQYSTHDGDWNQSVELFKSFNRHAGNEPTRIYMGLGWIPKSSARSRKGYDAAGIARKIRYGRNLGMKGFVIFILVNRDTDDSPLISALTVDSKQNGFNAPFKKDAPPMGLQITTPKTFKNKR